MRSGINYGADYVLYQRHPSRVHADFCVLVVALHATKDAGIDWKDLQVMSRLCGQVRGGLLSTLRESAELVNSEMT